MRCKRHARGPWLDSFFPSQALIKHLENEARLNQFGVDHVWTHVSLKKLTQECGLSNEGFCKAILGHPFHFKALRYGEQGMDAEITPLLKARMGCSWMFLLPKLDSQAKIFARLCPESACFCTIVCSGICIYILHVAFHDFLQKPPALFSPGHRMFRAWD